MNTNINLVDLADYLSKICGAYRKSYRFLSAINKSLLLTSAIVSSSALLALIPTVPVAVVTLGALPVIITIIQNNLGFSTKIVKYKYLWSKYKLLLSYVQMNAYEDPDKIRMVVFAKHKDLVAEEGFKPPMERYLRKYGLE